MLLDKVRRTIKENNLLNNGDSVICAVSGGADSVCLLHTMLILKREYDLKIYVANVNHLIRGEESDEDSRFVRAICKAADTELFYREYDVIKIAEERRLGEEECGRILRYEFFEELSQKLGGAKIATAHNLNDNAETVIFRMARGSSPLGLCGISHKRDNIIRPLLDVTRKEIEKYLNSNSISWREDSTNTERKYARNKIRLDVMGVLEEVSPGAQEKISALTKMIKEDNQFIDECAYALEKECLFENHLLLKPFMDLPDALKRRIAFSALKKWGAKEITSQKIESFISFSLKENGKQFDINSFVHLKKEYDKISYYEQSEKKDFTHIIEQESEFLFDGWTISVRISDCFVKSTNNHIAVFDGEKLSFPLTVRYRKDGDRINLKGMDGTKKLSDVFADAKIPLSQRDSIPVVLKDDDVLYIGGLRQSGMFKTDKNSKKFILIEYKSEVTQYYE